MQIEVSLNCIHYLRSMSKVQIVEATIADIPQILEIVNHNIVHETCIYDIEKRTLEAQLLWFENQ